jgi:HEAT repeat protein
MRTTIVAAALLCALVAAPRARCDDEDDNPSTNDLLVFNPCRPYSRLGADHTGWPRWWYANRTALLRPSYRATAGQPMSSGEAVRARAREALLGALASKNALVASEAALALGRLGDARDVATLAKIVADEDIKSTRRLHRYAALGLGLLDRGDAAQSADARKALVGAIGRARGERDRYQYFEANCAYALAMRGDVAALPELLDVRRRALAAADARGSIDSEILGPVVYALGAIGGESALPEIEEHLRGGRPAGGGSEDTSESACHALSRVPGEASRKILRRASTDPRERVRRLALQALGTVTDAKDDETAAVLRIALAGDKDPECRWMAAVSLGRSGHAAAVPTLLAAIKSRETPESDRACIAIGLGFAARAKPDVAVSQALAAALAETKDLDERAGLCTACGLADVDAARAKLVEFAGKGAPGVCEYAAYALGLAGFDEKKTLHEAVARSGDYVVRREAALALGMLRDATVTEQLREIAGVSKSTDLDRAGAAISLGRVGGVADVDFLVGLVADRDVHDQLRACVVQALGLVCDRAEGEALGRVAADGMWFGTVLGRLRWGPLYDIDHLVD